MRGLMEAAYEQQPLPTNLTGVPVSLYVLDNNHNYRQIGQTISDSSGTYSLTWTPDIAGNFTVYAVFAGTAGYWPSSAEAHFYAGAPQSTFSGPTITPASGLASNTTLEYGLVAIIIVIVIIGAILALLVTRKRP
jgi:hypothetical protein